MNNFKIDSVEKSSLKEFIETMKKGDGWYNPAYPKKLGETLQRLFGQDAEQEWATVVVRKSWTTGFRSSFSYWKEWEINVRGAEIAPWKLKEFQIRLAEDDIFGSRYETYIESTRTGYRIQVRY